MRHIKKFNESIDFTKSLEELVNTAIDNGDDLNEEGGYLLRKAIRDDRLDLAKLLIDNGADPNNRRTVVWSCEWGRVDALDFLLPLIKIRMPGPWNAKMGPENAFLAYMMHWLLTSDKCNKEEKRAVVNVFKKHFPNNAEFIENTIKEYIVNKNPLN